MPFAKSIFYFLYRYFFMKNPFPKQYFWNTLSISSLNTVRFIRDFQEKWAKYYEFFHPILHAVYALPEWAKVLDIWCGRGAVLKLIHTVRPDLKLYGCDIWDVSDFLLESINFSKVDFSDTSLALPYENDVFDLIISTQVLEHLQFPQSIVNEAYRIIKPGKFFFVDVPSNRMLWFPGSLNFFMDPTHIRPFTRNSLSILGTNVGFNIERIWHARNYPINGMILVLLLPLLFLLSFFNSTARALNNQWWTFIFWLWIIAKYKK